MRENGMNKPEGPAAVSLQWSSEQEFKQCFKQCKIYTVFPSALKVHPNSWRPRRIYSTAAHAQASIQPSWLYYHSRKNTSSKRQILHYHLLGYLQTHKITDPAACQCTLPSYKDAT